MNKATQVLVHYVIILGAAYLLGLVPAPGFQALRQYLQPFGYTLFVASTVCSLHNYRAGAIMTYAVALLLAFPNLQDAAKYAIPVGAGVLLGAGLRQVLRGEQRERQ